MKRRSVEMVEMAISESLVSFSVGLRHERLGVPYPGGPPRVVILEIRRWREESAGVWLECGSVVG